MPILCFFYGLDGDPLLLERVKIFSRQNKASTPLSSFVSIDYYFINNITYEFPRTVPNRPQSTPLNDIDLEVGSERGTARSKTREENRQLLQRRDAIQDSIFQRSKSCHLHFDNLSIVFNIV